MIPTSPRAAAFRVGSILCAASVLCCSITLRTPAVPASQSDAPMSKQDKYDAMISLTQQMLDLRPRVTTDPAAASLHQQLQHAYQQLSDSLGGDDPGRALRLRHSAVPRRASNATDAGALAGGPTPPPGCASVTEVLTDTFDTPIPDNGTIVKVLNFSDAYPDAFIFDVEVNFIISHTFNGDLDITLTSPAGTTVTLTSDNGGDFDNVFVGTSGTTLLNSANPGGSLPYATNNGLITDHNYVNNVGVNVVVPEESLAAFNGESYLGDWTLTVTDDSVNDTGTLEAWYIAVRTVPAPLSNLNTRTFTNNTDVNMPVPVALGSSTINVANMGAWLYEAIVRVDFTHTYNEDVFMTLTSPAGRVVTLTSGNGGFFDDVFGVGDGTFFDDQASPTGSGKYLVTDTTYANLTRQVRLTPEEALGSLMRSTANGTWTLTIADAFPGADGGTLNSWSLTLTTASCQPACPGDTNGDGVTNVTDLLQIISAWGNCP